MLRISQIESGNGHVVLKLEGRVAGPWVDELFNACETVLGAGRALKLNLADVDFLDAAGATLLAKARGRGVGFVDCSAFIEEQLKYSAEKSDPSS